MSFIVAFLVCAVTLIAEIFPNSRGSSSTGDLLMYVTAETAFCTTNEDKIQPKSLREMSTHVNAEQQNTVEYE